MDAASRTDNAATAVAEDSFDASVHSVDLTSADDDTDVDASHDFKIVKGATQRDKDMLTTADGYTYTLKVRCRQ